MLKEEFEELIKREVNENQYKNIETAYEALPEYMDKMFDNNRKAKGGIMCL